MGKKKCLNDFEKGQIAELLRQGLNPHQISKAVKRSYTCICNYLQNQENKPPGKKRGPKEKLTPRQKRDIFRLASKSNVFSREIKATLDLPVSSRTIRRKLNESKRFKYEKKLCKPKLTKDHKRRRLQWARERMQDATNWNNIVWSDEKKFNLDGPDGFAYYWHDLRKEKEIFSKRNFGGGSVMVWAGFSSRGKTPMVFITSRMNRFEYMDVLRNNLLPHFANLVPPEGCFQQDNAACHTAGDTMTFFQTENIRVLPWPAVSPDFNPMENLWGIISRRVYAEGRQFQGENELRLAIQEAWDSIPLETLQTLCNSIPGRIFDVILKKGAYWK